MHIYLSDTASEGRYLADFYATQLVRDRHARDMPAKSPPCSVLHRLSTRTPLCRRSTTAHL
jgi:hypothetical protein